MDIRCFHKNRLGCHRPRVGAIEKSTEFNENVSLLGPVSFAGFSSPSSQLTTSSLAPASMVQIGPHPPGRGQPLQTRQKMKRKKKWFNIFWSLIELIIQKQNLSSKPNFDAKTLAVNQNCAIIHQKISSFSKIINWQLPQAKIEWRKYESKLVPPPTDRRI